MSQHKPSVLVVGSGGAKGVMYLGALDVLHQRDWLDQVTHYAGVSIGSIITLLLCVGYTPAEIITVASTTKVFNGLNLNSPMSIIQLIMSKIKDVISNMGIWQHDIITTPLEQLITDRMGYVPTLLELFYYSRKRLDIVSYCLQTKRKVVFNHLTHPQMLCTDAVACSCTIPIIFGRKCIDHKYYIDGYFADPYPIADYDDGNNRILGMYIHGQYDCDTLPGYLLTAFTSYQHMAVENAVANSSMMVSSIQLKDTANAVDTIEVGRQDVLVAAGAQAALNFLEHTANGITTKIYNGPTS